MRRKDREITDFNEKVAIIRKCDSCVIAMNDGDFPYVVPMNFGMNLENGQPYLYFHCAGNGKKLDLLRKNPKVTFEMDCGHQLILDEEEMSCAMAYASVIGHGEMEFVAEEDKYEALKILMSQYRAEDFTFDTKMMKVTTVLKMRVLDMTGKRRKNC